MQVDWNGAGTFLGVCGAFIGSMATLYMQVQNWRDNRHKAANDARRERTLDKVAVSVGVEPEKKPNGKTV